MYASKKEIENIVNDFCKKNNRSSEMFEVSEIAQRATGGSREILYNKTEVTNGKCIYVIKYYAQLDIVVIWNYAKNHNMNYSYKTIKRKLADGIRCGDKGKGFHSIEQSYVFFDKGKNLYQLLKLIIEPI